LVKLESLLREKSEVYVHKSGCASQLKVCSWFSRKKDQPVIFIYKENVQEYLALAKLFYPEQEIVYFPDFKGGEKNFWVQLNQCFFRLSLESKTKLIFIPHSFLFWRIPDKNFFRQKVLRFEPGEEIDLDAITNSLIEAGYQRVLQVSEPGDFSLRGDILDIYSPQLTNPIRISLFGDLIEDVRLFEPISQKSIESIQSALVIPYQLGLSQTPRLQELQRTGELKADFITLQEEQAHFYGLFAKDLISILDWFDRPLLAISFAEDFFIDLQNSEQKLLDLCKRDNLPYVYLFYQINELKVNLSKFKKIFFTFIPSSVPGINLEEEKITNYEDLFWSPQEKMRPISSLKKYLPKWLDEYQQIIFSFNSEQAREKFRFILDDVLGAAPKMTYQFRTKGLFTLLAPVGGGYRLKWDNSLILSGDLFAGGGKKVRSRKFVGLKQYDDLDEGDLIVHRGYGVGIFQGLKSLQIGSIKGEYLLLTYANNDKLYLPVEKINLLQKYKGPEGIVPPVDRLGGTRWKNLKAKIRKDIAKIAKDLVQVYAYRKIAKRHAYAGLNGDYYDFEASFGFEETPDQAKAISEVMQDMESTQPMDRLVCGDVGFGKTEIALRAAFRAVSNGYQVAVLCPTTVLAEQHYHNFKKRMEPFGIRVEVLSRFTPTSKQKQILNDLKRSQIDVIIGTHRLLSKDVDIPKLSLLILDEEQRFGVRHKEKLKQLRKEVDVLTLTATPIPRTLQLSLSGIRSLSVIETPPPERKPVQTDLIERDPLRLKEIVEFELKRQGQVFWVYNRVQGLAAVKDLVQKLAPQAKVEMAHGQMKGKELEEIMHKFYLKEIDVLVCTSIIEAGLDFPNANTLIVDNAHLFGLGQLYQLRGRVGRSKEQAFAYFVVPNLRNLPEKAKKRLKVILSLDYLGAGFKLAMEDLRLRGAGNILGEAQSGQIGKVGLDMFLEMLEQEIKVLQGEKVTTYKEPELDIPLPAYIPEEFIADKKMRINYYWLLTDAQKELEPILAEIKDRYGHFPEEFNNFIGLIQIKREASKLNIDKIKLQGEYLILKWEEQSFSFELQELLTWIQNQQAQLLPSGEVKIKLEKEKDVLVQTKNIIISLQKQLLNSG